MSSEFEMRNAECANRPESSPLGAREGEAPAEPNIGCAKSPGFPHPGLDGKVFAIGVLSVTACVLFVGFLMVTMMPEPAYGIGQSDRGGDYIMLTQQLSDSVEGVVVIDAASKIGIVYAYDYNKKAVDQLTPRLRLDRLPSRDREKRRAGEQRP